MQRKIRTFRVAHPEALGGKAAQIKPGDNLKFRVREHDETIFTNRRLNLRLDGAAIEKLVEAKHMREITNFFVP